MQVYKVNDITFLLLFFQLSDCNRTLIGYSMKEIARNASSEIASNSLNGDGGWGVGGGGPSLLYEVPSQFSLPLITTDRAWIEHGIVYRHPTQRTSPPYTELIIF